MILPLNLAAATTSDGGDLREGLDPSSVTPGTLGFIFTLLIVVAVIFLIRDMTKRIRRVRYNAMLAEGGADAAARSGAPAAADADTGIPDGPEGKAGGPNGGPNGGPGYDTGNGAGTGPGSPTGRDSR